MASRTVRNRRLPSAVTSANYRLGSLTPDKETRRRLQRTPPRPGGHRVTHVWFSAPLYGRCLLLEANLCADCRWSRTANELPSPCDDPRRLSRGYLYSPLLQMREARTLSQRFVRERRRK